MKKHLYIVVLTFCISLLSNAQVLQKNYINYQGVATDLSGNALSNAKVNVQIALKFGDPSANPSYIEDHVVNTNSNGLFSLLIGNGNVVSGNYNPNNWGTFASYVTIFINGDEIGTTELMAVPYAISSGDTKWRSNGSDIYNDNIGKVSIYSDLEVIGDLKLKAKIINEFSTDETLSSNSDSALPTEKAVKTYVDNIANSIAISIDDLSDGKTTNRAVYLGFRAGFNEVSTINSNVGVGFEALYSNTNGGNNTALGFKSLHANINGSNNTATGDESLYSNTSGYNNTANGSGALHLNTSGNFNTAIGNSSLFLNNTGAANTVIGSSAMQLNTIGDTNTAIGYLALYQNSSGSGNVAVGHRAGMYTNGNNRLYISNSGTPNPLIYGEFDNKKLIFNGAITAISPNNTKADIVLSGTSNTAAGDDGIISSDPNYLGSDIFLRSNDNVAIFLDTDNGEDGRFEIYNGNSTKIFDVNEGGNLIIGGTLTQSSDRRLKKDIENLPYGLKEVLQLQPKTYNWKDNTQPNKSLGLIAQDVQKLIKEIVTVQDDQQQTLGVSYTELIPVLINAIKEQQAHIEALEIKTKAQDTVIADILNRLQKIEGNTLKISSDNNSLASKN